MNDRFKYRVYNKRTEEMLDVRLISYFSTGNICRVEAQNAVGDIKIFDDYKTSIEDIELMQSTGLKDKNGKLIYEGDVINVKIDGLKTSFIPMVVVWDRKEWQLKQYNKNFKQNCSACEVKTKQKCQYCSQYFSTSGHTNFKEFYNNEVIGNIYKNKELLDDMKNN